MRSSLITGACRARQLAASLLALVAALAAPLSAPAQLSGQSPAEDVRPFGQGSPDRAALAEVVLALEERLGAAERVNAAGQLLAKRDLEAAAVHYLMVLASEPHNDAAAYNLACTFALGGEVELGIKYLDRAVENGFWGWDLMRVDHDLDNLREHPRFAVILADVERRYRAEEPRRAHLALLALPDGTPPEGEWPLLVFLPGWGLSHESFRDVARQLAKRGVAVLVPAGPIVMAHYMHRWDVEDIEGAATYIDRIIARETAGRPVRAARPILGGFSQGAFVAAQVAAARPGSWSGVLAIAPAGGLEVAAPAIDEPGLFPLVLMTGDQDEALHLELARDVELAWRSRRQPVSLRSYPVGHRLPPDWQEEIAEAVAWIERGGRDLPPAPAAPAAPAADGPAAPPPSPAP